MNSDVSHDRRSSEVVGAGVIADTTLSAHDSRGGIDPRPSPSFGASGTRAPRAGRRSERQVGGRGRPRMMALRATAAPTDRWTAWGWRAVLGRCHVRHGSAVAGYRSRVHRDNKPYTRTERGPRADGRSWDDRRMDDEPGDASRADRCESRRGAHAPTLPRPEALRRLGGRGARGRRNLPGGEAVVPRGLRRRRTGRLRHGELGLRPASTADHWSVVPLEAAHRRALPAPRIWARGSAAGCRCRSCGGAASSCSPATPPAATVEPGPFWEHVGFVPTGEFDEIGGPSLGVARIGVKRLFG